MQVLLHSTNRYSQEEFVQQRMGAMVATAVLQPETSSAVLCREFYGDNYTLAQRLDMLHVLEAASKELAANPVAAVAPGAPLRRAPQDVQRVQAKLRYEQHNARRAAAAAEPSALDKARALVQQRLEAKTRRFSKGPSRPAAIAAPNAFAPVAGHFFFPLLQLYDRPNNTFDLLVREIHIVACERVGKVLTPNRPNRARMPLCWPSWCRHWARYSSQPDRPRLQDPCLWPWPSKCFGCCCCVVVVFWLANPR